MKLIIDIPEEIYIEKKEDYIGDTLDRAIANGTPLSEELEKIKKIIKSKRDEWIKGQDAEWHTYDRCLGIIENYISEMKGDKCDNDHDCEHCVWVECPN